MVNLNEYLLEKSREVVGRENNYSVVAGIITIIFSVKSVSQWDMADRGMYNLCRHKD